MSIINIAFDDGVLVGQGQVQVERGKLYAGDECRVVEKADVLYLNLVRGELHYDASANSAEIIPTSQVLESGAYVVCRGGLFKRVLP